jgi:rhodanese-related sulfurtransferase
MDEYNVMNIPSASCCPGGELVYRAHELAPDADTTIVVNCAGRTRSIIGAQSLINAGIENKVVALQNGTMGWHLSGFQLEHGNAKLAGMELSDAAIAKAKTRAADVARRFQVTEVDGATFDGWMGDSDRTTFLLDVRHPHEYEAGHLPGSISAPGGQLVQATDRYAGVRGARLVLVDDGNLVRATMAAHWLTQMHWDVYVLAGGLPDTGLEAGKRPLQPLGMPTVSTVGSLSMWRQAGITVSAISLTLGGQHGRASTPPLASCQRRLDISPRLKTASLRPMRRLNSQL